MSIRSDYKREVDLFCEHSCNVSGEEMLNMAKRNSIKETTEGRTQQKGNKKLKKGIIIMAAACVGLTAMTAAAGAAGYGPMASVFGHYIHDDATAKLAEEGYALTPEDVEENSVNEALSEESRSYPGLGNTAQSGSFDITLMGLAGDTQSPRLLIDLKVNDTELLSKYDKFMVYGKTLGAEGMEYKETQGTDIAIGEKDDTQEDLFHLSMPIPPYWVTNGEETYTFITDIYGYNGDMMNSSGVTDEILLEYSEHNMGMDDWDKIDLMLGGAYKESNEIEFRYFVPEGTLKESEYCDYTDIVFEQDGVKYNIYGANFGAHAVYLAVSLDDVDSIYSNMGDYMALQENSRALGEKLVLNADGKEYHPDLDQATPWCDENGECILMEKGKWYMNFNFDAVDYENAEKVTISDGTNTFDLK